MKITRKSQLSGIERTLDIDVTPEQIAAWEQGALIQYAMPNVSLEDREFILSGITKEEWNKFFMDDAPTDVVSHY